MTHGKPPTPSPTPPIFEQPLEPLLMAADNGSTLPPVLSINKLALGYNPFLGLEPHEQMGIYVRNEIFQFHVDQENVFLVQAGQAGSPETVIARFAAPLEYLVTPMLADCSYSSQESSTVAKSRDEYMRKTWSSKSMGMADITLSADASGGGATTGTETTEELPSAGAMSQTTSSSMPGLGGSVGASTTMNAAVGNSKEAQMGRNYESQGFSKSITTRLKRTYYKAGLRLDRFNKESFTPAFRSDARELGHKPFDFVKTIDFITKYGAYIFDAATMGASLYRSFFFSDDVNDGTITDVQQSQSFQDVNALVSSKNTRGSREEISVSGGTSVSFAYTDIERIGEFNSGSPASDSTTEINSCAIGSTIAPQVRSPSCKLSLQQHD